MAEKLKTAWLQVDLAWEEPETNRSRFEKKIEELSTDLDLIILPEMFTSGFSMNAQELAEPPQGPSLGWMKKIAAETDAAVTGSVITVDNNNFYNRLYFVKPNGSYQHYDKRHTFTLARENETYCAGKEKTIVNFRGWKICPLICYDLRFPVWSRNVEDYDLLLYVANWPAPRINAWDVLLQARAIENMSYCIGVNRVGKDGAGLDYIGHSAAYDSLGRQISSKREDESFEEVVLEKKHLVQNRKTLGFLNDRDDFILR